MIDKAYLEMDTSYKHLYITNNSSLDEKTVTPQQLFINIVNDVALVLNVLNISQKKLGFQYWQEAVFLFINSEDKRLSLSNQIYPQISEKNNNTAQAVERSMRFCFEGALEFTGKEPDKYIFEFLKKYIVVPKNKEMLVRITELIVSKQFQTIKSKFY